MRHKRRPGANILGPADRLLGQGVRCPAGQRAGLTPAASPGGRECLATQADTKVLGRK
jgi:hypothetical protein